MYYSGSTKYMCQATWHSYTHVIPPCRPWHMSTDVMPLTVRLSPNRLSLTTSLFEYVVTSLSHGRYSIIYKLHIMCKLLTIIYKLVIICRGCYATITSPTNMELQLPLHSISTRFYLTFFISHSYLTHVLT